MPQHLKVTLRLRWIKTDEYAAKVTTQALDSCYRPESIRHGLPTGILGLPEMAYIVADLKHQGEICADIVTDIVQEIGGIGSAGESLGVTVFVLVNGEIAGVAHQQFPRFEPHGAIEFPIEVDWTAASPGGIVERLATATACHDFDLLKIKGWPEFKTVMELQCVTIFGKRICTDVPVIYMRDCEMHVVAKICHPVLGEILGDVENCLKQAAAAGVIVGLITLSPAAAGAALTGYLKACLLAKGVTRASEISAEVDPQSKSCSDWRRKT